jgi:hypothetical protein
MSSGFRMLTLGSTIRRVAIRIFQVGIFLLLVFCVATGIFAHRYHVSLSESADILVHFIARSTIEVGVHLYDPCTPRVAELGPGSDETTPPEGMLRAEDFLRRQITLAATCGTQLQIVNIENETIHRSAFPFSYQPYDEPRLHLLRKKYHLDEVVAGASGEFEQMVRLRSWNRSQFRRMDYQPLMDNFDALEVLDRNLRNTSDEGYDDRKHFDPCHFFPLLYCQVMASMGHTARLVSIEHGMAEVWSNQYKKWVVMDAELDWHYEKDGIPLSMMEMHDENFAAKPSPVRIVRGHQSSGDENTTMVHLGVKEIPVEAMIEYHLRTLDIADMRNDWLTNHYFLGHPRRSVQNSLTYDDPRQPREKSIHNLFFPATRQRDDMYWTLNQTEIWIRESSSANRLELVLKTVTPNFDSFAIQVDKLEPIHSPSGSFVWQLHEGENSLSAVALNKFGVRGNASRIQLRIRRRNPPKKSASTDETS